VVEWTRRRACGTPRRRLDARHREATVSGARDACPDATGTALRSGRAVRRRYAPCTFQAFVSEPRAMRERERVPRHRTGRPGP
jgi:hypothetical protein